MNKKEVESLISQLRARYSRALQWVTSDFKYEEREKQRCYLLGKIDVLDELKVCINNMHTEKED